MDNSEYIDEYYEIHIIKEKGEEHNKQKIEGSEAGLLTAIASLTETLIKYNITTKEVIKEAVNMGIKGAKRNGIN